VVVRTAASRALPTVATLAAVGVVTAAIFLFREGVPVLSLGTLYVFAVLPVAVVWGRLYAVLAAVASMLAFNWFFLPPRHTLRLEDRQNWLALAVYLFTAIVVSDLAARSRRRAEEAERREQEEALLAELSLALLHGQGIKGELDRGGTAIASALGAARARVELGPVRGAVAGERPLALRTGDRRIGTLYLTGVTAQGLAGRERFLSALASLLAVVLDREELEREALEAERLRLSDAVKTAVGRAVSHDLRSPLTASRVAAESLVSPTVRLSGDEQARQLETVRAESRRLDGLVSNLLDLSRLQAGAARPERELVGADELLVQALAAVRGDEESVAVSLTADAPLVEVDPVQIEHTLVNLLENALRFSPQDELVRVDVVSTGDEAVFTVADRGPGIPPAQLERIFEPFTQAGEDERSGTGLGLAIARGFAEANGGRVWAESRPGEGARFLLALPLALAVEVPGGSPEVPRRNPRGTPEEPLGAGR
jgi:two-component system sensor histidine kinase KdpD